VTRGDEGPVFSLQSANAGVCIDGHNQAVAQTTRLLKTPNMPDMEKIETAICEYDGLATSARGADSPNCGLQIDDFCLSD